MCASAGLRGQVASVDRVEVHRGRHPLRDGDSEPVQLGCLVRVVAQQGYPVQPQGTQHLRRDRVVAAVLAVAEREVGVVRVEAGVLEAVGVELRIQTDPAALLAQEEQEPPDLRDAPDRTRAAAARSRTARSRGRRR